jgi:hypothetical protein
MKGAKPIVRALKPILHSLTHRCAQVLCVGLATGLFLAPASFAQEDEQAERTRDFLELEHTLSTNFVTPHTPWARPLRGGPIRTLWLGPWFQGSTEARELIELMQRADLAAKAIYLLDGKRLLGDDRPEWYGGDPKAGTRRALRLLNSPNDVVLLQQLRLENLPQELRDRLQRAVMAGAGLLAVGPAESGLFGGAEPVEPRPVQPSSARFYTLGKGRIVAMPPRQKLNFQPGWETRFDYQLEQQVRALLWAAKREPRHEPGVTVPARLSRASLPAPVSIRWEGKAKDLSIRLRRWDGAEFALRPDAKRSGGALTAVVPLVREGQYHLDVFARRGRTAEAWTTMPFEIESDLHVQAVQLNKAWAEPGEEVHGTVRLSAQPDHRGRVLVRLVDKHNRVLAETTTTAASGTATFQFKTAPWMPMLLRVEAILLSGNEEVSAGFAWLRLAKRHRDQFNLVVWCYPTGDLAPYGVESLAQCGTTAILQQGPPALFLADNQISYIPYATSFRASSHTVTAMLDPTNGVLKSGCVYDEGKMSAIVSNTVEACRPAREAGVLAYSLGDENAVRASCLSPQCLQAYRQYLREAYTTIEALNREWNSDYKSFDQIELLKDGDLPSAGAPEWFKEYFEEQQRLHRTDNEGAKGADLEKQIAFGTINDEMRALQAGNFARWYDRQAFQSHTYVQWCKRFQRAFRELDPQARTGFEGTDSFSVRKLTTRSRQGGDLDAFVRELDYFGPYGGPANHVVRSLAPSGFPMGNWTGYSPDLPVLLHDFWGQVVDGMNTPQWWRWDNLDGYHGLLMPTLEPFPAVRELLEDTKVLRDGLGTLLMRSPMRDDGVALLYSMPSTHIAHFDGNETYGDYKRDHEQWIKLVQGAGLQFRYVTDHMLRRGEFDPARYKVLILPLAVALDPAEAEVIRSFVRRGGTLIADVRPGLYDGHCKPLERGLLDDVFGIERSGKRDALEVDRLRVDGALKDQKLQMSWGNWHGHDVYPRMKVDPSVATSTGKALGQAFHVHYWAGLNTPICVANDYGRGRAILLNFSVFSAPAGPLVRDLFRAAGVQPVVRVTTPAGRPPKDVNITRWSNGGIELVSLFGPQDLDLNVHLPGNLHVCDLKNRQYLGLTTSFRVSLLANRAQFFALLPSSPSPPELELAPEADRGSIISGFLRLGKSGGLHAVKLTARTPAGKRAVWLEQVVLAGHEGVPLVLPFAQNDPVGAWEITATDLWGNLSRKAVIRVR